VTPYIVGDKELFSVTNISVNSKLKSQRLYYLCKGPLPIDLYKKNLKINRGFFGFSESHQKIGLIAISH
jgi:hypothetical protein